MKQSNPAITSESVLNWDDSMLVGNETIDDTHREFVALATTLIRCSETTAMLHLTEIEAHILSHFENEQSMMERTNFPATDCHVDEHNEVIKAVQQVRELYSKKEIGLSDVKRLAQALIDWFPGHIVYMDSALSTWLCKKSFNGAPIVFRRGASTHSTENISA